MSLITDVTIWLEADGVRGLGDLELHAAHNVTSRAEYLRLCGRIWDRWEQMAATRDDSTESEPYRNAD